MQNNTFGGNVYYNTFGGKFNYNSLTGVMRNSSVTGWVRDTAVEGTTSDGEECALGVFYCQFDGYYMGVKFRGTLSAADATERMALYALKGKYVNSDTSKYVVIPVTLTNLNQNAVCASRTLTVNSSGKLAETVDGDMTATVVTVTEEAIETTTTDTTTAASAKTNLFSAWNEEGNDTFANVNDDTSSGVLQDEMGGIFDDDEL